MASKRKRSSESKLKRKENLKFRWGQVKNVTDLVTNYSSFYKSGQEITVDDYVVVENEQDTDSPFIAVLKGLYEVKKADESRNVAVVHWFYRRHELPGTVVKKLPKSVNDQEIFESINCYADNEIDTGTIRGTCNVILRSNDESIAHPNCNEHTYYCRWRFDAKKRKLFDIELSKKTAEHSAKEVRSRRISLARNGDNKKHVRSVKSNRKGGYSKNDGSCKGSSQKELLKFLSPKSRPRSLRTSNKLLEKLEHLHENNDSIQVNNNDTILTHKKLVQSFPQTFQEIKFRLSVGAVSKSALPCREEEHESIYEFISNKLLDKAGGCIYVSGVPGTGKTATVHSVIKQLNSAVEDGQLPKFLFVEINGMRLTEPSQAYVELLKQLTGEKATAERSAQVLNLYFNSKQHQKLATVMLVDELDLLWTRKQHVMYNMFDWPTIRNSRLIVVAVANTMDLPERIMINRVSSRLGLTRLSFQPYNFNQLGRIIRERLANLVDYFDSDAIQFAARKVAAVSGDVRRAFDICRRAAELANQANQHKKEDTMSTNMNMTKVEMNHVAAAITETFTSPKIVAMRNASLHERLLLHAVVAAFRLSGVEEATFKEIYEHYISICRTEGTMACCSPEILKLCERLGSCRLLLLEPGSPHLNQRIRLNVSQDDVIYAIQSSSLT